MLSPLSAVSTTTTSSAHSLVKTGNGEITAASVVANPDLASGLVKLKNGNYAYPIVSAADRAVGIEAALTTLKLGGTDPVAT